MQVPKSFRINGKLWRVKWHKQPELEGEPARGVCDPGPRVITLKLGDPEPVQVFFHEWFHALMHEYCFYVTSFPDDLEEILAEAMSIQLAEILKNKFDK